MSVLIVFMCLSLSLNAQGLVAPQVNELETVSREFINLLVKKEFSSATWVFNDSMGKVLSPGQLKKNWTMLTSQVGNFKKQGLFRKLKNKQYDIVFITCEFEKATIDIKVILDSGMNVAGLFFLPSQQKFEYPPPAYSKSERYTEKEVLVGVGKWSLPGTLTIPNGKKPYPVVVLIHGAGPSDRDETIGSNKPFRDLAWGLASNGIAVLRYEKRTKYHASKFINVKFNITVEEEVIIDALAAIDLMRKAPEIDKKKIIVLGHSLGGMLIPRIGLRDRQIAGLVIMAGASRPMEDIIYEQSEYIYNLDGNLKKEQQQKLEQLLLKVQLVKSTKLAKNTPSALLPLGVPASYWLDLRGYDPAAEAAQLSNPMLILQGKRDYQVTMEDFKIWQNKLASHKNVQFKNYPTLNHFFIEGTGKSNPDEYEKPGHVHKSVIDDISHWIQKI